MIDEFLRDRSRYEAIVKEVGQLVPVPTTSPRIFEVSRDRDPNSLKEYGPQLPEWWTNTPADSVRLVAAKRDSQGRLSVVFTWMVTRHGGTWSLVYTDSPSGSEDHARPGAYVTPIDPNWRGEYTAR